MSARVEPNQPLPRLENLEAMEDEESLLVQMIAELIAEGHDIESLLQGKSLSDAQLLKELMDLSSLF